MNHEVTEEMKNQYQLTEMSNGWHVSKQGLVLTEDTNLRWYLSEVRRDNERDARNNELMEECYKILAKRGMSPKKF